MGILLMLVGLLTLASGAAKLRGRIRSVVGYGRLSLVEAVCGCVVLLGSGMGLARIRPLAWFSVFVLVLLTLTSNWVQLRRIANQLKKREMSAEWRLKAYLLDSEEKS